jgi:GNAT superfamily N-acetyltransferase
MQLRSGRLDDLDRISEIEVSAGTMFAALGMQHDDLAAPPDLDVVREQIRGGRLWVAVDADQTPVGYLALDAVDGHAHLAQVSVHRAAARQGVGRTLIEHSVGWAAGHGYPAMTLTTYADVPWNAPYYERCGFRPMAYDEVTPGLRAIRDGEVAAGLDAWPRVCMIRPVGTSGVTVEACVEASRPSGRPTSTS